MLSSCGRDATLAKRVRGCSPQAYGGGGGIAVASCLGPVLSGVYSRLRPVFDKMPTNTSSKDAHMRGNTKNQGGGGRKIRERDRGSLEIREGGQRFFPLFGRKTAFCRRDRGIFFPKYTAFWGKLFFLSGFHSVAKLVVKSERRSIIMY